MKHKIKILFLALALSIFLQASCAIAAAVKNAEIIPSGKYFDKVHSLLNKASKSILVAMYSFQHYTKYPSSPSNILIQDLIKAKERGVNVEVLLDISASDEESTKENQETGKILSQNGVKVYYDTLKTKTHTKTIVVDSRYSVVGSNNWTYSGLSQNNELSVLVDSPDLAKETEKYIMSIINIKKDTQEK